MSLREAFLWAAYRWYMCVYRWYMAVYRWFMAVYRHETTSTRCPDHPRSILMSETIRPKSLQKVTEMTLKWCLGDAWMVPEWSQNVAKKSWKVMFSAKKVFRKSQSWWSIKIHEFSWVMIVKKIMIFHESWLFIKIHDFSWVIDCS